MSAAERASKAKRLQPTLECNELLCTGLGKSRFEMFARKSVKKEKETDAFIYLANSGDELRVRKQIFTL